LRELLPKANAFALLVNPRNPIFEFELNDVREAMLAIGLQLHMLEAGSDVEVDSAFAAMPGRRADALLVGGDPFFNSRRGLLYDRTVEEAMSCAPSQELDRCRSDGVLHQQTSG
jgi:putative tryptophan/tyrosine transport system substrate-binding protein